MAFDSVCPFVLEITAQEYLDWIHEFTGVFDVDEYIYIDGCHVNGRGNQIIAQKTVSSFIANSQDNISCGWLSIACVTSSE